MTIARRLFAARTALIALCFAMLALSTPTASADSIDDVAAVLDIISKGAPGQLPFTGKDLLFYRDLIQKCGGSSNADDVIVCADAISKSDAGQQAGVPSWFPKMLDIYFDIKAPDYWGLVKDGGTAVACATGELLTGGVDICGAIKVLLDAANAVAEAAIAVAQFIEDVGAVFADVVEDISCWFSSCGPSPPKLSAADKAYKYFYFPRIPTGLIKRMSSPLEWSNYSGEGENFTPLVVSEGLSVPGGFTKQGLDGARPHFINDVNAQWDAKMIALVGSVQGAAFEWNPARATQYRDTILAAVGGYGDDLYFYQWRAGIIFGKSYAHDDCANALKAQGGAQVDVWIAAGGPNRLPKTTKFSWPDNYAALCKTFDGLLDNRMTETIVHRYETHINTACQTIETGNVPNHLCKSFYTVKDCWYLMDITGGDRRSCQWGGPGKGVYKCADGYKLLDLPEPSTGYKGCKRIYDLPNENQPAPDAAQ